jgi:hypothetical protein
VFARISIDPRFLGTFTEYKALRRQSASAKESKEGGKKI